MKIKIKKHILILNIILGLTYGCQASTRGDVKIIEASENIRYLSQKISKEYLYCYQNPQKIELKTKLIENMKRLEENIHNIEVNTQSNESKNILSFLSYTNEEIKELLKGEVTEDKSILLLDYSETFVEAANSIQYLHRYDFSDEEKMLMQLKDLEYLLERVTKYYMASTLNLNKKSNNQHMYNAIEKIEEIFVTLKEYQYPKDLRLERRKSISYWKTYKKFITLSKKISVPNLILVFIKNFKKSTKKIELYHKKNQ